MGNGQAQTQVPVANPVSVGNGQPQTQVPAASQEGVGNHETRPPKIQVKRV